MFELVLQAPEALVEPVSDALMDELDALSVSVEDTDADSASSSSQRRSQSASTSVAATRSVRACIAPIPSR